MVGFAELLQASYCFTDVCRRSLDARILYTCGSESDGNTCIQ